MTTDALSSVVIIPTYNEAKNIRLLVADIISVKRSSSTAISIEVLIVDDNSPDGTGQIADELAARYPTVHVIHRESKLGLGSACIAGFKYALARDYDPILTMDADFSHHPRYIPEMIEQSQSEADLVIGSRYVSGGSTQGYTLPRQLVSWGGNWLARTVLGLHAMDCIAGFRCYRRRVLESVDLDAILSDGYSFQIEMLYECQHQGWQVGEVPILFEHRRRGASQVPKQEMIKAIYTVLRLGKERLLSPGRRDV